MKEASAPRGNKLRSTIRRFAAAPLAAAPLFPAASAGLPAPGRAWAFVFILCAAALGCAVIAAAIIRRIPPKRANMAGARKDSGQGETESNESAVSLNMLNNILNGMDVLVYVTDPETDDILLMNDQMREHFGLRVGVVGEKCWQVLQSGFTERCEFCPLHKLEKEPGRVIVWEEVNSVTGRFYKNIDRMIEWSGGKTVHMQYSIDITELKEAEDALRRRLKQQELMSAISQSFITDDDIGSFINNALEMTGGFMRVCRISLREFDEKEESLVLRYAWRAESAGPSARPGGETAFRQGSPLFDALLGANFEPLAVDGPEDDSFGLLKERGVKSFLAIPVYVVGDFWGILEFDRCLEARAWSESDLYLGKLIGSVLSGGINRQRMEGQLVRLSAIVESSPLFIAHIAEDGALEYVNPAATDITGYSREEMLSGGVDLLFDAETSRAVRESLSRAIRGRERMIMELPMTRKNGETRAMSCSLFGIGGGEEHCGVIAMDITDTRQLENDLIHAKEQAEQSSKAKGEFLSRMSHEMRTPMNAIIGMTGIAKSSGDPEKKEYCLDKIDDASKHLLGVINDILDMSKIEANKFELTSGEFDFEKTVMNVTNMVNFRADEKKQTLIVNLDERLPRFLIGDEARISQVMTNLLTNAVKFTPEGGSVTLDAKLAGETDGECVIQIDVSDTGIGVTPEQQARLFNPFEQADGGIARKYGGTGLGLAISKRVVEMMGGRIWLESAAGKGSRFSFTVKAGRGKTEPLHNRLAAQINTDNLRILAVDDSPETREYFRHVMSALKLPCDVAKDGYEALAMLENCGDKPYNIFFVDWQMPGINGIELTKKIKEAAQGNAVIIMISVSEWSEIEKEASAAGVARFISKPLFPSTLIDSINSSLDLTYEKRKAASRPAAGAKEFQGHTLLLAEDMDVNREIMQAQLDDTGLTIEAAENGREALDMFQANPGKYSMILMDIHMPVMDGYEATRSIRALGYEEALNVPIVAMTANVFREDIEACLAAGMNGHVGKPVDTEQLFEKLREYLKPKISREKQEAANGPAAGAVENQGDAVGYAGYLPVIDVEDGLRRLMNNKKLFFSLLKKFSGRSMADELIGHIKNADFAQTAKTAHAMKGVSANLGLKELFSISAEIEGQAKMETGSGQLIGPLDDATDAAIRSIGLLLEEEGF